MDKPRTFKHFPEELKCPVCDTREDTECILIPIDGTQRDRLVEAAPVHLWCAVVTNYNKDMGVLYRRTA